MEENNKKLVWGLALGAAAGFVLGYLLSGKKVNEMADDLKDAAGNLKSKLDDTFEKGKQVADDLKNKF